MTVTNLDLSGLMGKQVKNPDGSGTPTVTVVGWETIDGLDNIVCLNLKTGAVGPRPLKGAIVVVTP